MKIVALCVGLGVGLVFVGWLEGGRGKVVQKPTKLGTSVEQVHREGRGGL